MYASLRTIVQYLPYNFWAFLLRNQCLISNWVEKMGWIIIWTTDSLWAAGHFIPHVVVIYFSRLSDSFGRLGRNSRSVTNATICLQVLYICFTLQSKWNTQGRNNKRLKDLTNYCCFAFGSIQLLLFTMTYWWERGLVTYLLHTCLDPAVPLCQRIRCT